MSQPKNDSILIVIICMGDTQSTGATRSQCSLDISTFRASYKAMTVASLWSTINWIKVTGALAYLK